MGQSEPTQLLRFFKALADSNRLKIVGLLAGKELTVEQLAAMLDVKAPTASHHLSKLTEAGLVSARAEGYYSVFRLEVDAIKAMSERLSALETFTAYAVDVDVDAFDRRVWANFSLPDGRLKTIPAQRKKRSAVLRHLAESFKSDTRYSEKRVNKILSRFHEDTATLRREMVGEKLLTRQDGVYWRGVREGSLVIEPSKRHLRI